MMIGLSMIGSLFLYWALVHFMIPPRYMPRGTVAILRYALYFVAVMNLSTIVFLKRLLLRKTPADTMETLTLRLRVSSIITLAISEAPALYGLALYFSGGTRLDFYIFAGFSLMLLTIFFPRLSQWEAFASQSSS